MSDSRRQVADQRYIHFVTFSVCRRRQLLDLIQPKRIVLEVLRHQLEALSARCVGYVLMPDHVHALVWLPESRDLSRFLHGWKRMSSFSIRAWYKENAPSYWEGFGLGDRFWLPKYYAFQIHRREKLEEKLDYMHLNPVRAGFVEKAVDWQWSSARWYVSREEVGVPIEWVDI